MHIAYLNVALPIECRTRNGIDGELTNADALPTFRILENGVAMGGATTGTLALDGVSTGYYKALYTPTAANGFEVGKYYTIEITAQVDGVADQLSVMFMLAAALPANFSSLAIDGNGRLQIQSGGGDGQILLNAGQVTINGISNNAAAALADAVCDEALSGHALAGSLGKALSDVLTDTATIEPLVTANLDAANSDVLEAAQAAVTAAEGAAFADIPVNQVPCGPSRTWKLVAKGAALVGELPLFCTVDDDPVYAIDFSADLPTNGRLTDFVSIEILSAVDANGDPIEDGLEFDTDGADTFGVDKSQAKLKITAVTAGTYTLKATVEYRDADGGGTRRGKIVLKVGE